MRWSHLTDSATISGQTAGMDGYDVLFSVAANREGHGPRRHENGQVQQRLETRQLLHLGSDKMAD